MPKPALAVRTGFAESYARALAEIGKRPYRDYSRIFFVSETISSTAFLSSLPFAKA